MADKIATYAFASKENYEAAKYKIRNELGDYSWGEVPIYWSINIMSDCKNPSLAAQICLGYGGKPH